MKDINELKRELFDAIESICKDYEKPAEPEFKVGQWVYFENLVNGCLGFGDYGICRIVEEPEGENNHAGLLKSNIGYYVRNYRNDSIWKINAEKKRPATPSEIGAHLRKIMEQKGFKKGVKYCDVFGNTVTIKGTPRYFYDESCDMLGIEGIDPPHNDVVYRLGKFAEIIPDKKKLPKTREEFMIFLSNHCYAFNDIYPAFLDEYDFES